VVGENDVISTNLFIDHKSYNTRLISTQQYCITNNIKPRTDRTAVVECEQVYI